jgi:hypothetical protein
MHNTVTSEYADALNAFTAKIRKSEPSNDEANDRVEVYRSLFRSNIQSFLEQAFPVLHQVLPERWWRSEIDGFLEHHQCASPYFHDISMEFIRHSIEHGFVSDQTPDWVIELMHYEWLELHIQTQPDEPCNAGELTMQSKIKAIEASALQVYQYPVHMIGPCFTPKEIPENPTPLLMYRNLSDGISFEQLSPLSSSLYALIMESPFQVEEVIKALAHQTGQKVDVSFEVSAFEQLNQWLNTGAIICLKEQ